MTNKALNQEEHQYRIPLDLAEKLQRLADLPEYKALLHYLEEYKLSVDDRLFSTPISDVGKMAMVAAEWKGSKMVINLIEAVPQIAKDVIEEANSKIDTN